MTEEKQTFDEAKLLQEVQKKNFLFRIQTYFRLSGPGWLQSAISLGGGSLASSLYLGVLAGYSMLWLQPIAMLLGIVMLSALGYITLASGQRPFHAINRHVNPVLGWAWALAALLASMIWALPQFSLATSAVQQNLLPGMLGAAGPLTHTTSLLIISAVVLAVAITITWNYDRGSKGVRAYEWILKGMVGIIMISFIGVVIRLTFITGAINWGDIGRGLIPDPSLIFRPADGFLPFLDALSETSRAYWSDLIVNQQINVMAAALSSAVGINMTFLFAYSMLRRRWGPEYQGLMKFDMLTGMFIPFTLATGCVLIASTSQFHTEPQPGFLEKMEGHEVTLDETQLNQFQGFLENRVIFEHGEDISSAEMQMYINELTRDDYVMAATLITRDAFDLAFSLEPLLGEFFSHIIFGIGVLGMAISSITLMMLISGLVLCEIFGFPRGGWVFRIGSLAAGLGVLGPFFWQQAYFWLAIPVSVITLMLLPIAYFTFFLMINNRALMGKHMFAGKRRVVWNSLMILALVVIASSSFYMLWLRGGSAGLTVLFVFLAAVVAGEWIRRKYYLDDIPADETA